MTKLQSATKDFLGTGQSETVTGSLIQKSSHYSHRVIANKISHQYWRSQTSTKIYTAKSAEISS